MASKSSSRGRRAALLALFAVAGLSVASAQRGEIITTTGAKALGTVTTGQTGSIYWLRFVGDEVIEFQIDTATPEVAGGILRIHEMTSDSWPVYFGGVNFRDGNGSTHSAFWLKDRAHLDNVTRTADSVIMNFTDNCSAEGWGIHHRRHTYQLQGKNLRLHIEDLDRNPQWAANYCGVYLGPTREAENPQYIEMQGGLLSPIVLFRNGAQSFFMAQMLDLYNTNAANYVIDQIPIPGPTATSFTFSLWTHNQYKKSQGTTQMSGYLDDTYNFTVSSKIKDVLVTPSQGPSPYRALLAGRTMVNMPANDWPAYGQMWNQFASWGIDDLAGYFFSWSAPKPGSTGQGPGPSWHPARDPANFATTVQQGRARGYLLGGYMAFNIMGPNSPPGIHDLSHVARDEFGNMKMSIQTNQPLLTQTAAGIHATRESGLFRNQYGGNMAYIDIQTYASPVGGADGDHIDQVFNSGWARTLGKGVRDQKHWMGQMQGIFEGPIVGEGSISGQGSNCEWLWAGYCDSVQRVINSGGGTHASDLPAGSPLAPTNWPVIPEYEWRVFSKLQANHGNGFAERFFGRSDGPTMVNMSTGQPIFPLTEPALDRYRLYEITYGKAAFFTTNGPYDGGNSNYLSSADMLKEHYLMNALQTAYLENPPRSITYLHNGQMRTFESILFETRTTDTFREARIKLSFANGLEIYVNHNDLPWSVTVAGTAFTIPEDGFVARNPGTGLIAFSAIPSGVSSRIDYCFAPNRYEFFDGRGAVNGYGNIDTGGIRKLKLQNFVHNTTVTESASGAIQVNQGTQPTCIGVAIFPATATLARDERRGFQAIATYSNGAKRNVTTLVDWSSSTPTVARVDEGAAVLARGTGTTTIQITSFQGAPVTNATVNVP